MARYYEVTVTSVVVIAVAIEDGDDSDPCEEVQIYSNVAPQDFECMEAAEVPEEEFESVARHADEVLAEGY